MISFPQAPENLQPDQTGMNALKRVINNIMRGKTNNRGTLTLAAGTTTTIVEDVNVGGDSIILLEPTTANAAAAFGTTYASTKGKQTFTMTHANNAQTDRIFNYVVIG